MLLAQELNAGFVPVRKPKKLPYDTISASYELEYGTDTLEMHKDAIQKGDRVLIHDDVLATGGTILATSKLIQKTGAQVVSAICLLEIAGLPGSERLQSAGISNQCLLKM